MASHSKVIYIGVTSNLISRIYQHKNNISPDSFTARYNCHKLVYFEEAELIVDAIAREKQLKKWRRQKKIHLIESMNSSWLDLSRDLGLLEGE